ncbi:MAG: tryptophan-rich sensory protein [Candidatus Paracaedibacteraceae bacterium]|nr:tryptophan-rich sensory protein [Candidatus Paracaedibacteraceae bacterium]
MQFKLTIKTLWWILVFLAISYFIGKITLQNMEWYQTLTKSPLTPPRIVFPIVWNLLYIMLASAGSLLWARNDQKSGKKHLIFFAAYMFMNWSWSLVFFAKHMVTIGFIWIIISNFLLLFIIISLWLKKQKIEFMLLTPTLLWGIFAAYLNGYIFLAN